MTVVLSLVESKRIKLVCGFNKTAAKISESRSSENGKKRGEFSQTRNE